MLFRHPAHRVSVPKFVNKDDDPLVHGSITLKNTRVNILANRKVTTILVPQMTMSQCLKRSKNMKLTKKNPSVRS